MNNSDFIKFEHSYTQLPYIFYAQQNPTPVANPKLIYFNERLASGLGLESLSENPDLIAKILSGNVIPHQANPIAQAYAGHQFGYFTKLGDGRAILLGEINNFICDQML